MRRWSCASIRSTYSTWNRIVGTVKKSTDTIVFKWFSRKVRQVCEGGLRRRTIYLLTLVWPMSMPSIEQFTVDARGAPDRGLAAHGADQLADLCGDSRPPRVTVSDLPGPEQAEALAVPANDGGRLDDEGPRLPVVPDGA